MRRAGVVTPEAVPLELQTAGVGSRFVALVLDGLVVGSVLLALTFALTASGSISSPESAGVAVGGMFLLLVGYPVAWETLWRGRTPGKAALGLRVVTVEGAPVRFRHAAIRSALGLVDFALSLGAVAVIAAFASPRNQRLGDMVAGTVVLRERTGAVLPRPTSFRAPEQLEGYAAQLDTAALTEDDYGAVRNYLLRAPALPPAVAADLARKLADALVTRVRPAPPPGTSASGFLAALAAAYQRRLAGAGAGGRRGADTIPAPSSAPVAEDRVADRPARRQHGDDGFAPME